MKAESRRTSRTSRRKFLKAAGALSGVALLSACGAAPTATPTLVPKPTTAPTAPPAAQAAPTAAPTQAPAVIKAAAITVWTFLDITKTDPREKALKAILDSFKAKYPQITVTLQTQPFRELGPKFIAAAQTGNAPDVCWIRQFDVSGLMKLGLLADLNKYWPESDRKDFPIQGLSEIGTDGAADYSASLWPSGYTLYYRKDLFAKAGIKIEDMRTWDQFIANGKLLTQDTNKDGRNESWGFSRSMAPTTGRSLMFLGLLPQGVEPINRTTGKSNWNNDAGVKALTMFTDMVTKDKIVPREALTYATADTEDQFAGGLYGMHADVMGFYPTLKTKATWGVENIGLARFPTFDGKRLGPVWVTDWELSAWKDSKNPEAAWTFLSHILSPESDLTWVKTGGQLPTRASTLKDPFFSTADASYIKFIFDGMSDWSWSLPWRFDITQYEPTLLEAENGVIAQGTAVKTALENAAKKYDSAL